MKKSYAYPLFVQKKKIWKEKKECKLSAYVKEASIRKNDMHLGYKNHANFSEI